MVIPSKSDWLIVTGTVTVRLPGCTPVTGSVYVWKVVGALTPTLMSMLSLFRGVRLYGMDMRVLDSCVEPADAPDTSLSMSSSSDTSVPESSSGSSDSVSDGMELESSTLVSVSSCAKATGAVPPIMILSASNITSATIITLLFFTNLSSVSLNFKQIFPALIVYIYSLQTNYCVERTFIFCFTGQNYFRSHPQPIANRNFLFSYSPFPSNFK